MTRMNLILILIAISGSVTMIFTYESQANLFGFVTDLRQSLFRIGAITVGCCGILAFVQRIDFSSR